MIDYSSPSVLLVGFDPRTALAVARSLYRKRIPVIVGTICQWETPLRSRAIQGYVALPGLDRPAAEFLSVLTRVVNDYKVDTIIPINDRALLLLAPHHAVLKARLRLACPWPEQISSVLNKETTTALAAKLGLPVPVAIEFASWAELAARRSSLKFPLVAKSRDKAEDSCSSQIADPRLRRFNDFESLRNSLEQQGGCDRGLLLQEYCPGDDVGLAILTHQGSALTVFQYRAHRLFPSEGGVCVLACTEKVDTQLMDCALRLLRAMAWEGVAQIDFRHDPETGRFALLEINGRFWGSAAVAVAAGLDFPYFAWQLAHGRVPDVPSNYKTGLLVRWMEGDMRRLLELRRHRQSHGRSWVGLVLEGLRFVAAFRPGVRDMFWSWRDPLPFFDTVASMTRWWLVARCKRASAKARLFMRLQPARNAFKL